MIAAFLHRQESRKSNELVFRLRGNDGGLVGTKMRLVGISKLSIKMLQEQTGIPLPAGRKISAYAGAS